ncbi:MAG: ComF family protein [Proteobacteria bacterium]|nr:ComF family protein [Pseudomonadota bacterium]
MAQKGLDLLLPPLCPATGVEVDAHGTVAADYWVSLRFIRKPFCEQCALPFPHDLGGASGPLLCGSCIENPPSFRRARSALIYDDASRSIITRFKYGDQLQAIRSLVPWLKEAGAEILVEADVLVPVPLHRWRLLKRRYNQSALLVRALGAATGKVTVLDGLQRIRPTPTQGRLTRKEREENMKGAFAVRDGAKDAFLGKNIVLVDDVFTTGATLNACAKALYDAGALSVDALTIARVPKD